MWNVDDPDTITCAVAIPTGLVAFNIGGVTAHRLFQLPVEHSEQAEYWALNNDGQKAMHDALHSVKLVVIDEMSILFNLNFKYIHKRLNVLFSSDRVEVSICFSLETFSSYLLLIHLRFLCPRPQDNCF